MFNMLRCETCGFRFKATKEGMYLVSIRQSASLINFTVPETFEAFDCPRCGCQLLVGKRYPEKNIESEKISLMEEEEDEDELD